MDHLLCCSAIKLRQITRSTQPIAQTIDEDTSCIVYGAPMLLASLVIGLLYQSLLFLEGLTGTKQADTTNFTDRVSWEPLPLRTTTITQGVLYTMSQLGSLHCILVPAATPDNLKLSRRHGRVRASLLPLAKVSTSRE